MTKMAGLLGILGVPECLGRMVLMACGGGTHFALFKETPHSIRGHLQVAPRNFLGGCLGGRPQVAPSLTILGGRLPGEPLHPPLGG